MISNQQGADGKALSLAFHFDMIFLGWTVNRIDLGESKSVGIELALVCCEAPPPFRRLPFHTHEMYLRKISIQAVFDRPMLILTPINTQLRLRRLTKMILSASHLV